MKTNLLKNTMLSLSALAGVALISQVAFAGNGGAYNGPDLSGSSIPVSVDREVTIDDVTRATYKCAKQLAQDLGQQFGQSVDVRSFRDFVDFKNYLLGSHFISVKENNSSWWHDSTKLELTADLIRHGDSPGFDLNTKLTVDDGKRQATLNQLIPHFDWNLVEEDSVYDELGNVISARYILKDLRLALPKDMGTAVPMINSKSKHPSRITINMDKIATCLLSHIQQ